MGQKNIICSFCGSENEPGTIYCNSCGKEVTRTLSGTEGRGQDLSKTVMMGEGSRPPSAAPSPDESQDLSKTILDPSAGAKAAQAAAAQAPQTATHSASTVRQAPGQEQDMKKTMLGASAVSYEKAAASRPERAVPAPASSADMKKTQLGGLPAAMAPPQEPQARPVPAPAAPGAKDVKKTMLGMPAADLSQAVEEAKKAPASARMAPAAASPEPAPGPSEASSTDSGFDKTVKATGDEEVKEQAATMDARAAADEAAVDEEASADKETSAYDEDTSLAGYGYDDEEVRKKGLSSWIYIVAGFGAIVIIGVVVMLLMMSGRPEYSYSISQLPGGKNIAINVSIKDAPAGSTVTFLGLSQPTVNGAARFEIPLDQIKLGENVLKAGFNSEGKSHELEISVNRRHKVDLDLKGLGSDPPFFEAVFTVAPGESLAVDGKSAPLDAQNSFRHRVSLDDAVSRGKEEEEFLSVPIQFQLQSSSGQSDTGEHLARLPLTKLRVDRPAPDAVVDLSVISCSGETEEGASLSVNGKRSAVTAGRFEAQVPLEGTGEHEISVVSRAPGKAPKTTKIKLARVASLQPAAEKYMEGADANLDYPTLGRDPDAYVGRKISFKGRIVNIRTEQGVTVFILYLKEGCPSESRCAVYVVFRGESSAGLYSWVSVYGEIKGKRTVQIREGESMEVPALEARYVIPEQKKSGKKRRRRRR